MPKNSAGPVRIESIEAFWLHDGTKMGAAFPRIVARIYTDQGIVGEAYTFFWRSRDRVMEMTANQNSIENGIYRLPEGPGFGYIHDEKIVAKYRHD